MHGEFMIYRFLFFITIIWPSIHLLLHILSRLVDHAAKKPRNTNHYAHFEQIDETTYSAHNAKNVHHWFGRTIIVENS
jgi:hypothetical protein